MPCLTTGSGPLVPSFPWAIILSVLAFLVLLFSFLLSFPAISTRIP